MSILDGGQIEIQPATRAATQLINMTIRSYQQMVNSFNRGAELFWANPQGLTPTEIADALGTNGQEVFQLHYALGQLIGSVKPEAIAEGAALVGEFSYNEDGSLNIVESTTTTVAPTTTPAP